MITPLAHRFGETEIHQKSVIDHIVDHMTGREAMYGDEIMDTDAIVQAWAGMANKDSQNGKEGGRGEYRRAQKDCLPEPAQEQHPTNPQGGYHDRGYRIIETTDKYLPNLTQLSQFITLLRRAYATLYSPEQA
jgi:hypothetical protein